MRSLGIFGIFLPLLVACAPQEPLTPEAQRIKDVAYLRMTVEQCAAVVGFEGVSTIQKTANRLEAEARKSGATDAQFAEFTNRMRMGFAVGSGMQGAGAMCSDMLSGASTIVLRYGG